MREELDSYLCKTYPKLFSDRNSPMTETCMCWGFEHGDGWFRLIDTLCRNIQSHLDWKNTIDAAPGVPAPSVRAPQVPHL